MHNLVNSVAVTLLVALLVLVPGSFLSHYVPGFFNPGLQRTAVVAWLAALGSWFVARAMMRREQEAAAKSSSSSPVRAVAMILAVLAVAVGLVYVLHAFGGGLLG